jgi:predicted amidophosphoribosyltransferase
LTRVPDIAADLEGRAENILLTNRWLNAAASLLGTNTGCVTLAEGNAIRLIARGSVPHAFIVAPFSADSAPFGRTEQVLVRDATNRPDLHAFLGAIAFGRTGFFYRRPLIISEQRTISLVLFGENPLLSVADREIALVEEIGDALAVELERYYPSGVSDISPSLRMNRADIERWLHTTELPVAIFDTGLRLLGANAHLRALFAVNWDALMGEPLARLGLPAHNSLEFLFLHAITSQISTPRMDLTFEDSGVNGQSRTFSVVGSPLTPIDGPPLLIATLDPNRMGVPPLRTVEGLGRHGAQATVEFLTETLVQRRALRSRGDVSYVTLRSWRQTIREHQIRALKAIKQNAPDTIADVIAADIRDDVKSLFGVGSFKAVVPVPCGHSPEGYCLSVAIAQALGRELNLPVAHALLCAPDKGSSHPKRNAVRPAMSRILPVEGPILLIDDVATSGRHIEEATKLLRAGGASVLAMAWIGGDAS